MKKSLVWLVAFFVIMMLFVGVGCKEEAATEETTEEAEETTEEAEETTEEAEETTEEAAIPEITTDPMTIDLWIHAGTGADLLTDQTDLYTAEHPNITFNITTHSVDNLKTIAPLAIKSGQEKLDFLNFWKALSPDWVAEGLIIDLAPYMEQYKMWDDITPAARTQFENPDGTAYYLPTGQSVIGMLYYNEDIFEELGIEMDINTPGSVDELIEITDKLKAAGYEGISVGNIGKSWMTHVITTFMGRLLSAEDLYTGAYWDELSKEEQLENLGLWNSDEMLEAYKVLDKLTKAGAFIKDINLLDWDPARELFVEGKAGMFMDGTWGISLIRDQADEDFNFGAAYLPPLNGVGTIQSTIGGGYCIPSYVQERSPEKIPVIVDFFSKINGAEYAALSLNYGSTPVSVKVPEEVLQEKLDPVMAKVLSDSQERGTQLYMIQAWAPELFNEVADTTAAVIDQVMTPEEAVQALYDLVLRLAEERE